jgi:hypothetical protein
MKPSHFLKPLKHTNRFFLLFLCASVSFGAVYLSAKEKYRQNQIFLERSKISVIMPTGAPALGQESIDIAMEAYGIKKSSEVNHPVYVETLEDRGLTTGGALQGKKEIFIGPAAFTSWAVLGSTLGHEIEIHGNQSFFKILAADRISELNLSARSLLGKWFPALKPSVKLQFDSEGTWKAEREAYLYELKNSGRFGLSADEQKSVSDVMNFYYPRKN